MNKDIKLLKEFIFSKQHHSLRRTPEELGIANMAETFNAQNLTPQERMAKSFFILAENEKPTILPFEKIVGTRTITRVPEIFTAQEWEKISSEHFILEKGYVFNLTADYENILNNGLGSQKEKILKRMEDEALTQKQKTFLESALLVLTSMQSLITRYENAARNAGREDIAQTLEAIESGGAKSLRQALQLLRFLHFFVWLSGSYHNTLGRFDQYIYPFYKNDIESKAITKEEAFDLIEEFFLACNRDSDLYIGMQQGDNGQSLVLGGRNENGEYAFNEVSEMCLKASYELAMIDPKINIRVDKNTPLEIYEKGSQLTKIGLGFPQYSNDDVVIPSLIEKGYSKEDAHNYTVAACWEFIVPKRGTDMANIDSLCLIDALMSQLEKLPECKSFDEFFALFEGEIFKRAKELEIRHKNIFVIPSPVMSLLMESCIENARDISEGGKYNNFGIHGTGISTAADSLAAIKKYCFDEKSLDPKTLLEALGKNFEGFESLQKKLREQAPKMGCDDDFADEISCRVLDAFSRALAPLRNERGGIYRAGTGTAMFYIFHSKNLGATPDGRSAGEVIPANYSPSLFMEQKGPLSVIKSFCKPELKKVCNGGPLTLEFDQCVFRNDESVKKLGMLVRTFVMLGGHQLQLNAVSREKLLDAKKYPELHRSLIVRVWGWSGYFVELDECYQDHVINRIEFSLQ